MLVRFTFYLLDRELQAKALDLASAHLPADAPTLG